MQQSKSISTPAVTARQQQQQLMHASADNLPETSVILTKEHEMLSYKNNQDSYQVIIEDLNANICEKQMELSTLQTELSSVRTDLSKTLETLVKACRSWNGAS